MSGYAKDYDKGRESSEPKAKGHAAAVKEAMEDHKKGMVPHPSTGPMPMHPGMHSGGMGGFDKPGGDIA